MSKNGQKAPKKAKKWPKRATVKMDRNVKKQGL